MTSPACEFPTLPDYLVPGLDLVFLGINPSVYSVEQGHYFARRTNRFWPAFSRSRLSESIRRELGITALTPEHDFCLPRFGIGLTDVVKRPTKNAADLSADDYATWIPVLLEKLRRFKPRVACFHGLTGYRQFQQRVWPSTPVARNVGEQPERIGRIRLYVVPNPSGANAHCTPAALSASYDQLADFLKK